MGKKYGNPNVAICNIWIRNLTSSFLQRKEFFDNLPLSHDHQTHVPTCGLLSGPKFMLGVDCSDTEGDPREDVMTGQGDARPFNGEPKVDMGDGNGLEVLMTDG